MTDSKTKLEALRAAMREEEAKKANGGRPSGSSGGDKASYPFWNIPENTAAVLRFLPDKDDENLWFWVERQIIRLPFQGISGGDYPTSSEVNVTVPCVDMFGDTCPIIAHTRPWWRDDAKKDLARKYYKKRSFIAQGFVVSSPFEETDLPENPIRRFLLGPSLLEKIKAGLADPDMENHPTDYLNGCDFRVRKTKKQDYNNYDTSEWARRSRALSEAEHIAIEKSGLFDLKEFKGPRPDADGIEVIKAMFLDSLAGRPFDHDSYGKHYRAYGGRGNNEAADAIDSAIRQPANNAAPVREAAAAATTAASEPAPADQPAKGNQQDIMTALRSRISATRG
jgi:hypothetical protein